MLTIDRLRLHLPGEYRDRAHLIARLVADELSEVEVKDDRMIDRVSMPPVRIIPGTADQQIARQIAAAVQSRLNGHKKNKP